MSKTSSIAKRSHIKWFSLVRIVGLTLVLIYHFFRSSLPGGFFGVDVFFVFSGYLITALIVEEFRRKERFSFTAFIKRRFVRTFPPLLLAVIFTLPFALLLAPDFVGGIGRQVSAALGFATNYFEIIGGGSYEAQLLPHMYVHTWSLALEMQYYLVWGLLCAGLVWLIKKIAGKAAPQKRVDWLCGGIIAVSLVLSALCWWNMQALFAQSAAIAGENPVDPSRAYFASTSRALPFFIGSAAGALLGIQLKRDKQIMIARRRTPVAVASIAVMILSAVGLLAMSAGFSFGEHKTYCYGVLAASVLVVLLIWAARLLHESAPRLREPKVFKVLADLSYGVFLAHWPLYVVFSDRFANNWAAALVTLALSLLFAAMVFYIAEPLLQGKRPWAAEQFRSEVKRKAVLIGYPALAVLCVLAVAGSVGVFWRAPGITSLEQGIVNGELYQQTGRLEMMHSQALNIKAPMDQKSALIMSYADAPKDAGPDDWMPAVAMESIPGGVTFVGDSVSLGANKLLVSTIPDSTIDSTVSRSFSQGTELIKGWAKNGSLQEYVIVSLGTNGYDTWKKQVDQLVDAVPAGHRLILVTPYMGKPKAGYFAKEIAAYYRELAKTLPYVTVADWAKAAAAEPDILAADRIHFGNVRKCSRIFTDLVMLAVQEAGQKPVK